MHANMLMHEVHIRILMHHVHMFRTFEQASAMLVKKVKRLCVGFRNPNCALLCSRLISPVRNSFPGTTRNNHNFSFA